MEKYLVDFAKNLKTLREEKNLSIRDLASALDISKSSISQWENCKNDITLGALKKIANYFDVDMNWLIGEKEERR